ncbi:hypothetical protein [Pararhodonellum marinum]|uniref:hypothetical protein n=1 Tax=Pararhodonellum marinum TaxID=2755358 RepID=UPI00188E954F|nr:hypothetical protein [Pararhodonellum marinum]
MKTRSINCCCLDLLFMLLFSCRVTEEELPKTEIEVDTFWAYENGCFQDFFQGLSMGETTRITDYEDFEQIIPCFIYDEVPDINFDDFFLLVTWYESTNVPAVRNQRLVQIGSHEFTFEIEVEITDFPAISAVYCFGVIPIELLNNDIKIEFI